MVFVQFLKFPFSQGGFGVLCRIMATCIDRSLLIFFSSFPSFVVIDILSHFYASP